MLRMSRFWCALVLIVLVVSWAAPVSAGDFTFTGAAGLATPPGDFHAWSDPRNWSPAGVPGPGDTATISRTNSPTVNAPSSVTIASLNFSGGNLAGGAVTVTQGGTWAGGQILNTLNVSDGATFTCRFTGDIVASLNDNGTINNAGTFNISGDDLNGGGASKFNNTGTLNFDVDKGLGATTVNNSGVIRKRGGSGQSAMGGGVLNNNGLIDVTRGILLVLGGGVSVSGGTYNAAAGAFIRLQNRNTFRNATFIGAGRTEMTGLPTDGSIVAGNRLGAPGSFVLAGSPVEGTLTTITNGRGKAILDFSTITGTLNVPAGSRFDLTGAGQTRLDTPSVVNNAGTFNMNGNSLANFFGTAPPVFNNSGTLVFSGGDSLGGATGGGASGVPIKLNNTGVVRKRATPGQSALSLITLQNSGLIDVQGGVLIAQGASDSISSGTFNAAAGAVIQLQNRNTFQHARFTGAGTTQMIGLDTDGTVTAGTAPGGDGDFRIKGGTISGNLTVATAGAGSAAFDFGTLGGTLNVPQGSSFDFGGGGQLLLTDNATVNNSGTVNYHGDVGHAGTNTTINNMGTLNLFRGASLFRFAGTALTALVNSGTINLDPAGPAAYSFDVDFTQTSTGRLNLKIGGVAQTTQYDLFFPTKAALAGTLSVDLINNFVPQVGQEFDVLRYASHTGQFSTVTGPFRPRYEPTQLVLEGLDNALLVSVTPGTFSEGAGPAAATGRVTRIGSTSNPLTVALHSSDPAKATVPASVVIPAGAASISFHVAAVDNAVVDGPRQVTITATAAGLPDAVETVTVTDNDVPRLTLNVTPQTFSEDAGPSAATGTITRNTLTTGTQTVNLSSSNTAEATVPATVTIPAGVVSTTFRIAAINDTLSDGPHAVTITAGADGFIGSAARVSITDSVKLLRLSVTPTVFAENAGANAATGTVTRSAASPTALTVNLSSSDTTEATVPATVTIPAGAASVTFHIAAVADNLLDGSKPVGITASAPGFVPSGVGITVLDNKLGAQSNVRNSVAFSTATAHSASSSVNLSFTGPLHAESASDATHYSVLVNGRSALVESAGYDTSRHRVTLLLPEGALPSGGRVVVGWHGLLDSRGHILTDQTPVLTIR